MPNSKIIPVYEPFQARNQKKYVNECLDSNILSWHSPFVEKFEKKLANYLNVKHCLTVCNGSVSLMLILKALNIGHGDEVITQNLTYAATVSSIINVGATPVIIDSDSQYQMDISLVEASITSKTKAVMVAGLYGDCCDILKLKQICDENNVYLIEDAAELFGSTYLNKKLGSFGEAGSFSFFSNKTLMAVEAGAVVTNNDFLAKEMYLLRGQSHVGNFLHKREGYNFRFNGVLAAIGLAQLEEIDFIISKKQKIAEFYRDNLNNVVDIIQPSIKSAEWMPLFCLPHFLSYKDFNKKMLEFGIETRPCFTPISLMPGFQVIRGSKLDISEMIYKFGFNLPSSPNLTETELNYVVDKVNLIIDSIL